MRALLAHVRDDGATSAAFQVDDERLAGALVDDVGARRFDVRRVEVVLWLETVAPAVS